MLLLEEKNQNKIAIALAGIGLAITLNVGYRSFFPPKTLTPETLGEISEAQENNQRVSVNYVNKPYLNTLIWKLFLATGFFASAYALADGTERSTFQPDPAMPVSLTGLETGKDREEGTAKRAQKASSRVAASTDFHHEVSVEVGNWCKQFPWLMGLLRPPIVMVVGQPGAGKSSLMQAIALVRHLLFNCGVDIADLDVDKNIKNKVWLHGVAHGSAKRGDYFTQLETLFARLKGCMFPKSVGHTLIWDEVSRMVGQEVCTENELIAKFHTVHKEFRRQNIKTIMGLHGLGVDENMTSKSCGTFTSMRDAAAILYVKPKNDEFGDPMFSGVAYFKPAGQPTGRIQDIEKNWQRVAIPTSFQAKRILEMLGDAADDQIGIVSPDVKAKTKVYDWAANSVDTRLNHRPGGWADDKVSDDDEADSELTREFFSHVKTRAGDFSQVDDLEELQEFWEATEGEYSTILTDKDGVFRIRTLWRGWAKNQDWPDVASFKEYLQELEDLGIGIVNETTWAWRDNLELPWE